MRSLDMFARVEDALGLRASDSAAGRDCVQLPFAGHALELGAPSFVELDPRARRKVFDRAGDDHFTGPGLSLARQPNSRTARSRSRTTNAI